MVLNDVDCWGGQTVSTHHQHLIQQSSRETLNSVPGCSRGCYYGYGHGYVIERSLVCTRIPRGQATSTSFSICENKRTIEWLLKQSLNAFKLIQYRFNLFQHGWKGRGLTVLTSLFNVQQNRTDVEGNVKAVCPGLNFSKHP